MPIKHTSKNAHKTSDQSVTSIENRSINTPAIFGKNAPPNPPMATSKLVVHSSNPAELSFTINNAIEKIPPINRPDKNIAVNPMITVGEIANNNKLKNCPKQQITKSLPYPIRSIMKVIHKRPIVIAIQKTVILSAKVEEPNVVVIPKIVGR